MAFYLTKYPGAIIGPVAALMGIIMNGVYNVLSAIGIENIGLAIIVFTLVVNLLMTPLTIRTQRFSKLSQRMSPELNAIRKKYEGKKDNTSVMAQNEEIQQVYAKYGVSQMGSCLPLLIQFPLIIGLYRVIHSIPAYVGKVRQVFVPLATTLLGIPSSFEFLQSFDSAKQFARQFTNEAFEMSATNEYAANTYIDVLNKLTTGEWQSLSAEYPSAGVESVFEKVSDMNNFLGLNISNTPSFMMSQALENKTYLMIAVALLVPFLAAASQWISVKLMPQASSASKDPNDPQAQMAGQTKTMNTIMPLISAWFCYTLPIGVGIYWIAGAIIRVAQQIIINKQIDKMDLDALIAKNQEKYQKKLEKRGEKTKNMSQYAGMNTRNASVSSAPAFHSAHTEEEKEIALRKAREFYESGKARKGSLMQIANMVRAYDEKNN